MLLIGPMMREHRLIEKMIRLLKEELSYLTAKGNQKQVDHSFIEAAVDFIGTYADQYHHGKEEGILFKELKKKNLSDEHERTLQKLIKDHGKVRSITLQLAENHGKYKNGDGTALNAMVECINWLVDFYPDHIKTEDRDFFMPVMEYFTDEENEAMLSQAKSFDRMLIHEKYENIVEEQENFFESKE